MSQRFNTAHIARLAQIHLSPEELSQLDSELPKILDLVNQLASVDTSGTSPTYHPLELCDRTRPDAMAPSLPTHDALSNAPASSYNEFCMPKVVETA